MAKDKHIPKDQKKRISISDDASKTMYGIMIILICLISLLNRGFIGEALTFIGVYLFGVFYFVFYSIGIVIGFYLIFKKKFIKIKINLIFLGIILLFFGFILGASLIKEELTITNCFSIFNDQISVISPRIFQISSLSSIGITGGGIIGFFLVGILNTAISSLGTNIITIVFLALGLVLMFKDIFVSFFNFIAAARKKNAEKRELKAVNNESEIYEVKEKKLLVSEEAIPLKSRPIFSSPFSPVTPIIASDIPEKNNDEFTFVKREEVITTPIPAVNEITSLDNIQVDKDVTPSKSIFHIFKRKDETETQIDEVSDVSKVMEEKKDVINFDRFDRGSYLKKSEKSIELDLERYLLPSIALLSEHNDYDKTEINQKNAEHVALKINEVFRDFKIKANVINYTIGPSVTRFDVKTEPGVRVGVLSGFKDEICVKLAGNTTVRIETVVAGRDTSGIEVGNIAPTTVSFKDVFSSLQGNTSDKLLVPLGKNIEGKVINISLDSLPHLLIAGTTGSGKSVFVHSLLMSLIMRNYPDELKMLLIDPKKVEFTKYAEMPHLYCPIISDADRARVALVKLVDEMERRYSVLARLQVSNIKEYRKLKDSELEVIPNLVVIIDEYADLLSNNNAKQVEPLIQRLAQKARACGIYLIVATQRPSVSVITGDIKANIPARIALSVSSAIDSRTIIDEGGAEALVGKGDLLARIPALKTLVRLQSPYVDNDEISKVVTYLKTQAQPHYNDTFLDLTDHSDTEDNDATMFGGGPRNREKDPMYDEIKTYVMASGSASSSGLRRYFGLGYSRSASILDMLEDEGIIKTVSGNGRKEVIKRSEDSFDNE